MKLRNTFSCTLFLMGLALFARPSFAAEITGRVVSVSTEGKISGLEGAPVSVINISGRPIRSARTNRNGLFAFPRLAPGKYFVSVQGGERKLVTALTSVHVVLRLRFP